VTSPPDEPVGPYKDVRAIVVKALNATPDPLNGAEHGVVAARARLRDPEVSDLDVAVDAVCSHTMNAPPSNRSNIVRSVAMVKACGDPRLVHEHQRDAFIGESRP